MDHEEAVRGSAVPRASVAGRCCTAVWLARATDQREEEPDGDFGCRVRGQVLMTDGSLINFRNAIMQTQRRPTYHTTR